MTVFSAKFFKLLHTFSAEELKSFDSWLKSPWCNSNKNLVLLLDKVKKYHPDYKDPKLTKEKLFKKILPTGKYSDRRMNNLFSKAYIAAEEFMLHRHLTANINLQKDILTTELQNRHEEDWFFKEADREISRLENIDIKSREDDFYLLRLHLRKYHHTTSSKRQQPRENGRDNINTQLDRIYLQEKAVLINEHIFRQRIFKNESYETETELQIWNDIARGKNDLKTELYRKRFAFHKSGSLADFKVWKTYFEAYCHLLNSDTQKIVFTSLINEGLTLIRTQRADYKLLFSLYKFGLKTGFLLHNGIISFSSYSNLVTVSNTLKETEFTLYFIDNYTKNLAPELQESVSLWAKAHTAYYLGNLQKASDILLKTVSKSNSLESNVRIRILNIQIHFELHLQKQDYTEYLLSYIDATEKWNRRRKDVSEHYKIGHIRFLQICRMLIKATVDVSFDKTKLEGLLDGEKNLQAAEWLGRQIEAVLKM